MSSVVVCGHVSPLSFPQKQGRDSARPSSKFMTRSSTKQVLLPKLKELSVRAVSRFSAFPVRWDKSAALTWRRGSPAPSSAPRRDRRKICVLRARLRSPTAAKLPPNKPMRTHPFSTKRGTSPNGKAERFIQTSLREWAYAAVLLPLRPPRRPSPTRCSIATTGTALIALSHSNLPSPYSIL